MEQRLIDANAINVEDTIGGQNDFADCIRDSVQMVLDNAKTFLSIPENPTNGDMIKALFSDLTVTKIGDNHLKCWIHHAGYYFGSEFPISWWNAPYKEVTKYG